MGRTTAIEWTEHTWNPMSGCSLESAGCTNCYAMRLAHRLGAMGQPGYQGLTRASRAGPVWTGELRLAGPAQLDKPRRIRRPAVIFVNSMSDLFHPDAPDSWRDAAFEVMTDTPRHTYQVLTKRPQVALAYYAARPRLHRLPHIWIGASVENARVAGRIGILRQIPAGLRFLSLEPLIAPVGRLDLAEIGWAITGGESGPHARPCNPDWVRDIRDQCVAAGVPFFHKQWGSYRNHPDVLAGRPVREVAAYDHAGKGGALLDGKLWRQVPGG